MCRVNPKFSVIQNSLQWNMSNKHSPHNCWIAWNIEQVALNNEIDVGWSRDFPTYDSVQNFVLLLLNINNPAPYNRRIECGRSRTWKERFPSYRSCKVRVEGYLTLIYQQCTCSLYRLLEQYQRNSTR